MSLRTRGRTNLRPFCLALYLQVLVASRPTVTLVPEPPFCALAEASLGLAPGEGPSGEPEPDAEAPAPGPAVFNLPMAPGESCRLLATRPPPAYE